MCTEFIGKKSVGLCPNFRFIVAVLDFVNVIKNINNYVVEINNIS